MNQLINTIPANPEDKCDACGRKHRKLHIIEGFFLGARCLNDYKIYKFNRDIKSIQWKGYEKQYNKIKSMIKMREHISRTQKGD